VAAVVCVASSQGGTTAQSLKTGFLVGGTPKAMQYAILVGTLVSAVVIGGTLLAFNAAGTVYSDDPQYLPKNKDTGEVVTLTPEERARLTETQTYQGKQYLIWDTRRDSFTRDGYKARAALLPPPEGTAPVGRFLVDPDSGKVAWLKDPTIGGQIKEYEGRETTRFDAPKTQVMRIIIDGVLTRKLNWSLVLIGALIAVTLELCGVSSLAFAVGIYVPIQYSTPIFIGGLVRAIVDRQMSRKLEAEKEAMIEQAIAEAEDDPAARHQAEQEARARAEVEAIRKSETSPGVLLASGYIAGGSLAGVVVAFLEFAPGIKDSVDLTKKVEGLGAANDIIAIALFAVLVVFAALVGLGKLFKPPEDEPSVEGIPETPGEE
jgi:hypothetical protein